MTTFTEVLPVRKSSKKSALNWTPITDNDFSHVAGVLVIHTDRTSAAYTVSGFPVSWPGRGYTLAKVAGEGGAGENYNVFCSDHGEEHDSCCCKGHTYNGTCKHCDAVRALVANGWL